MLGSIGYRVYGLWFWVQGWDRGPGGMLIGVACKNGWGREFRVQWQMGRGTCKVALHPVLHIELYFVNRSEAFSQCSCIIAPAMFLHLLQQLFHTVFHQPCPVTQMTEEADWLNFSLDCNLMQKPSITTQHIAKQKLYVCNDGEKLYQAVNGRRVKGQSAGVLSRYGHQGPCNPNLF